ncbi:MAG: WD40 repeat domain-containing protein, partial [Planctomycetia bacterium]
MNILKPFLCLAVLLTGLDAFSLQAFAQFKELVNYKGHTDGVKCVAFRPDGKSIASGAADNLLRVWNPANGKEIFVAVGHKAPLWAVT